MTTMVGVMTMDEDNSNLAPRQPEAAGLVLPEEPTPQDYGFPEKPNAAQLDCWRRQEAFLDAYRRHGIMGLACEESGVPVHTAESWDFHDRHGFKKRRALADRSALGVVEAEVHRRAIEGVDHPVIHQGVITDTYKTYSDNLLMFRAKRLDPSYRDNYSDASKQDIPRVTQINIIMPPGVNDGQPLVIDGAAKLVPDDEDTEANGAESSSAE